MSKVDLLRINAKLEDGVYDDQGIAGKSVGQVAVVAVPEGVQAAGFVDESERGKVLDPVVSCRICLEEIHYVNEYYVSYYYYVNNTVDNAIIAPNVSK